MTAIRTTIHQGRINVSAPEDLQDGTEVTIDVRAVGDDTVPGDGDWDDSPEGIADWMKWYDSLEPFILTDEEVNRIAADRTARKAWETQSFNDRADRLAEMWK